MRGNLEIVPDIIVPLVVSGANIAGGVYDIGAGINRKYKVQPIIGVAGVAIGLFGTMTGRMDKFAKPLLHASMPAAALGIYQWVKSASAPAGTKGLGGTAGLGGMRSVNVQADNMLQYKKGGL